MNLSHNETQFFNTWKFEEERDLKAALTYLNQRLNEINRQVSFWDVYNVTQVLLNDNDLTSKLALLSIGEAAIVNANVLTNGTEYRYRGDIAYRKADGEIIWIDAENKGIYKPSIQYNGMLQITYSYQSKVPDDSQLPTDYIDVTAQQGYLINIDVFNNFTEVPPVAPIIGPRSFQYLFDAIYVEKDGSNFLLKPLIKFYFKNNNGLEDFYADYSWEEVTIDNKKKIKVIVYFCSASWFVSDIVFMRVR